MEDTPVKSYLAGIETISSAATRCNLDFSKMNDISCEIAELSSFFGLSSIQTILFCCMAELSFQRTVTLDHLAKHLKCGVFKLITFINEIEALEKKGYVKKTLKVRGRKHSYNDIGYTVPHTTIEAARKSDISLLAGSAKCDLPGFLKQVSTLIDERNQNSIETSQLLSEIQFLINANPDLPFVEYVDSGLKQLVSKCTVFAFSYQRLKGMTAICIESYANALFDDLSEQLEFAQQVCSGRHELVTSNFLNLVTSDFDGDKLGAISGEAIKVLYKDYPDLLVNESK
ncbi:MAG TPA: hypothetical protein VK155_00515, partial [Bacteroidales bacterium]|nr:hypothetical protein [Bacteroidales bacterium]